MLREAENHPRVILPGANQLEVVGHLFFIQFLQRGIHPRLQNFAGLFGTCGWLFFWWSFFHGFISRFRENLLRVR